MSKIPFDSKQTDNITRIKKDDIRLIIYDAKFVLDEFYYDKQIAYMSDVHPYMSDVESIARVNPIKDIYNLIETINFALDNVGNWDNNLDHYEIADFYSTLSDLKHALKNAMTYAKETSQFKDKYKDWTDAYHKDMETSAFSLGQEKLENKIKKEANWAPTYHKGKIYYSYFTEYHGQNIPLKDIERADGKRTLSPAMVKERMEIGF